MLTAFLTNWNNKPKWTPWILTTFCLSPEQDWGLFWWRRTAIKPHSVSSVAAGQMDFSTVHESIDDESANNCFSASRNIRLSSETMLLSFSPFSFLFALKWKRLQIVSLTRPGETRHLRPSDVLSPSLVALETAISPASSWPPSHLGAPPSLSQGAFQWAAYCGGWLSLTTSSSSVLYFACGCCCCVA